MKLFIKAQAPSTLVRLLEAVLVLGIIVVILIATGALPKLMAAVSPDCIKIPGHVCQQTYPCAPDFEPNYNARCDKDNKLVCCVPTDPNSLREAACQDKKKGDACDSPAKGYSICNSLGQCLSRCKYCVTEDDTTHICDTGVGGIKRIAVLNSAFDCQCSITECNTKTDKNCAKGFCTGTNYCCSK
jgi:hypothetical protein